MAGCILGHVPANVQCQHPNHPNETSIVELVHWLMRIEVGRSTFRSGFRSNSIAEEIGDFQIIQIVMPAGTYQHASFLVQR